MQNAWGAWYNANTGAKVADIYTQVVEVTLFDLKDGETLFQKTYEASPKDPTTTGFTGKTVGEFGVLAPHRYLKEDLVPLLDGRLHAYRGLGAAA